MKIIPPLAKGGEGTGRNVIFRNATFAKPDGEVGGLIGTIFDTTEIKQAEEALQKSEDELQKRVKELEEFYDMAVGRELRMIEMKEEVEMLKEELKNYKKP